LVYIIYHHLFNESGEKNSYIYDRREYHRSTLIGKEGGKMQCLLSGGVLVNTLYPRACEACTFVKM